MKNDNVWHKFPGWYGYVWVKRKSEDDPVTVGDHKGLSVEYFSDVTHWKVLEYK